MPAFLFTDIESSTRLWEEHPAEMATALARHDAILEACVRAAGGRILKMTGDGAIAVFDSPGEAVGGAADAQLAVQSEPWPTTPLRVRMGIHAGDAQPRGDDYFGPVMNRTARIMAAAHGGQVLLSSAAADVTSGDLADQIALRDLGSHRLRDLTMPEHLYQLIHPDLDSEFPPPRTLDARPNNLPYQPTDFLGRTQELAAARLMLDSPGTRLLTIAGPGGAGKTRLSLQLAAELTDAYRDGVFFIDLADETEPSAALETIIRTLALPVSGTGAPLDVLKTRLRDRHMLLVLDNFEQVIAAGPDVADLLLAAPDLEAIVTSRETLRVRGEVVFPVPPLSLPNPDGSLDVIAESEAVQLFADRAISVSPTFSLTEANAPVVAAICLRLDGLPLAIELAAARLNVFSPGDLLERIQARLDVLASGGRDLPDRQRTLWGAISWSYELLTDAERELFELLSVFTATRLASIEAVAEELGETALVIDTLSSLVDKSLVRSHQAGPTLTFSMLQMIREYAAERLADRPDHHRHAVEAHARHFADFAAHRQDQLRGSERHTVLAELETGVGNLRTAWRHWVDRGDAERVFSMLDALWALHDARGWYHAAIELTDDALRVVARAEASPERAARELTLSTSRARALMAVHGYNLEVEQAFRHALDLAEADASPRHRVPVLRALASYYLQTGDSARSHDIGEELLQIGREVGDEAVEIEGHLVIGNSLLYFDVGTCLAHLDEVVARYDPSHHRASRYRLGPNTGVVARIGSALMLWETGRLDLAVERAAAAVEFATEIDHPYSIAWALYHLGFLAVSRSRFDESLAIAQRLGELSDEHNYTLWRTLATVLEGVSRTALGDPDEGVALTEKGIDLYQGLAPPPVFWPLILGLRAAVHAMAGNLPRALHLVDEAVAIWQAAGATPPELWVRRADLVQAIQGPDDPEVEAQYLRAIEGARQLSLTLSELKAQTRLVALRRDLGRPDDGASELRQLLATFTEGHEEMDVVAARAVLDGGPSAG